MSRIKKLKRLQKNIIEFYKGDGNAFNPLVYWVLSPVLIPLFVYKTIILDRNNT